MFGFAFDFLGSNGTEETSTSNDPVRFTHLGFNSSAGEFSGLLKEWKQLVRVSNTSGVASSIWGEMGAVIGPPREEADSSGDLQTPVSHLAAAAFNMRDPNWLVQAPCWHPTQWHAI